MHAGKWDMGCFLNLWGPIVTVYLGENILLKSFHKYLKEYINQNYNKHLHLPINTQFKINHHIILKVSIIS